MKTIQLTQGKFTIVDDEDYDYLSKFRWYYTHYGYAARTFVEEKKTKFVTMHAEIMGTKNSKKEVDHINRNKLDNRKQNLRICSHDENVKNTGKRKNNTSGYKGVFKRRQKWIAQIAVDKKTKYLGLFNKKEDAAKAYDKAAKEMHGAFSKTNGDTK